MSEEGFPDFSGFIRILISCPNFFWKKDKFFIFIFCKKFIFFLLFLGFSAKISTKKIVPIFENSQGQCPRIPIFLLLRETSVLKFLFDDKNLTQNPRGKEKRRGRRVKTKGRIEGQAGERETKVNKKEENQFVKKRPGFVPLFPRL